MWLKLAVLLVYVLLLFILSLLMESLYATWCDPNLSGCSVANYTCRLLDPMLMSVVQLKAILDQRGLSYDGVVERSELNELVTSSGHVSFEELAESQLDSFSDVETNFTSGAHFIEQVEDAKDSVWLVQVVRRPTSIMVQPSHLVDDVRWKGLKRKMARFGVRMGRLDCSLDYRYCNMKGWKSSFMLLALPSQHEKKANVAMYNFSNSNIREASLIRWVREKLNERVDHIPYGNHFDSNWRQPRRKLTLDPEIRTVLFTSSKTTPLFYSALSVKFPGRVKFGRIMIDHVWQSYLNESGICTLPAYVVYTAETNYTFGYSFGEFYSFNSMERFLRTLYPCLNDIFIVSFCLANALSWLEFFIVNCNLLKRVKKSIWCVFKYNMIVILLWLPIISVFQIPYLDQVPLIALKSIRTISLSPFGQIMRGYQFWYQTHPNFFIFTSAAYLLIVAKLCSLYRSVEPDDNSIDWFNFSQMHTLRHLRPNSFLGPSRVGTNDLLGGLDLYTTGLSQPSLWLPPPIPSDYIQRLPTWKYNPIPLALRAQAKVETIRAALVSANQGKSPSVGDRFTPSGICCSISVPFNSSDHNGPSPPGSRCACFKVNDSSSQGHPVNVTDEAKDSRQACEGPKCQTKQRDQFNSTPVCTVHKQCDSLVSLGHDCSSSRLPPSTHSSNSSGATSFDNTISSMQHSTCHAHSSGTKDERIQSYVSKQCHCSSTAGARPQSQRSACTGPSRNKSTAPSSACIPCSCSKRCNSVDPNLPPDEVKQWIPGQCKPPAPKERIETDLEMQKNMSEPVNGDKKSQGNGFPQGYLESHQCVICLDEYIPQTSLCGLPCGHVFHETCIISWLNLDKHFCPVCRWPSFRPR